MKHLLWISALFLLIAGVGCEKEGKEQTFNNPEELLGAWSDSQINGDVWVFRKVDKLKDSTFASSTIC